MIKNLFVASAVAVLFAGAGLGCSGGDGTDPIDVVDDVFIFGIPRAVTIGNTLQFEGRAATSSGMRVDELVSWSVSTPAVLSVTGELLTVGGNVVNRATVTGLAAGSSALIATAGTVTYSVQITVSGPLP